MEWGDSETLLFIHIWIFLSLRKTNSLLALKLEPESLKLELEKSFSDLILGNVFKYIM